MNDQGTSILICCIFRCYWIYGCRHCIYYIHTWDTNAITRSRSDGLQDDKTCSDKLQNDNTSLLQLLPFLLVHPTFRRRGCCPTHSSLLKKSVFIPSGCSFPRPRPSSPASSPLPCIGAIYNATCPFVFTPRYGLRLLHQLLIRCQDLTQKQQHVAQTALQSSTNMANLKAPNSTWICLSPVRSRHTLPVPLERLRTV
jgi:hypothetical protein